MSNSNCCLLTCVQVSQEAGQVVWYFHLFQGIEYLLHPKKFDPIFSFQFSVWTTIDLFSVTTYSITINNSKALVFFRILYQSYYTEHTPASLLLAYFKVHL